MEEYIEIFKRRLYQDPTNSLRKGMRTIELNENDRDMFDIPHKKCDDTIPRRRAEPM